MVRSEIEFVGDIQGRNSRRLSHFTSTTKANVHQFFTAQQNNMQTNLTLSFILTFSQTHNAQQVEEGDRGSEGPNQHRHRQGREQQLLQP